MAVLYKHLHALEIFVVWCASSLVIQNYSALQTMNFHSSMIPDILSLELVDMFDRTVLYPVVVLLFLNQFSVARTNGKKLGITLVEAAVLTGLEGLSSRVGVFVHVTWPLWGTAVFWLMLVLVTELIWMLMRKKLFAEV